MSDFVWISRAPWHPSNLRPFRHDMSEADPERSLLISKKIERGEPLASDEFPAEIFGALHATETDYKLPDLFYAYGFWVVRATTAEVLRQFDLGNGSLVPVQILKRDQETLVPGEFFCFNIGNVKTCLEPVESRNLTTFVRDIWKMRARSEDGDVAFNSNALEGPDVWLEEKLDSAFLFSDRLVKALKKAEADKGFFFVRGRLV